MVKAGVIGVGYMGALHARVYSQLNDVEFAGIYDQNKKNADEISAKYNVSAFASLDALICSVDALSIATPTILHFEHAKKCIDAKKHVLIEKPMTADVVEAKNLVDLSVRNGTVIGVGYIERFNPAVVKLMELLKGKEILSIMAQRLAPPMDRANDVSAVFDLMIHDLDIIIKLTNSEPVKISASGKKAKSPVYNDVHADIILKNGVAAQLTASKISDNKQRTIRVVCKDLAYEADLIKKLITIKGLNGENIIQCDGGEPIRNEIIDFINAIEHKTNPRVSGRDAILSLKAAFDIEASCSISE